MANYDLTYEGSRVQGILDTGNSLKDAGYIFRGEATPSTVPGTPTERVAYIGGPGTYTNFGSSITVPVGRICVFKYTGSGWSNQVIDTKVSDGASYKGIATPTTNPGSPIGSEFYIAVQAGTYTNFGSAVVTAGLNVLKYNGSAWSVDQVIAIDAEPTQGSANLVKSGGVLNSIIQNGPAFDISAYNAQGGVLATYADLSAALTALNALPADFKKGGMSVKFVQSSDNKYVQYRLLSQTFNTQEDNWQPYYESLNSIFDFTISDENNNDIVRFSDGHIKTKNFDSKESIKIGDSEQLADLTLEDENGNSIAIFSNGNIKTKRFDSERLNIKNVLMDFFDFSIDDNNRNSIIRVVNGYIKTKNFNSESVVEDVNELKRISTGKHFGSFSILGDSYSTYRGYTIPENAAQWYPNVSTDVTDPTQQWWYLFANEYKSLLKDNISWSGAPISYDGYESGTGDGKEISFITRANTYLTAETKPELLLVFGGTNDAWIRVNIGENQFSDWTDEDLNSFRPALCKLMHDLTKKKEYIGMQVVMMWNNGLASAYTEAARDICNIYNVPILELSGVTKLVDHPDAAGMITIKNQLINFLKTI